MGKAWTAEAACRAATCPTPTSRPSWRALRADYPWLAGRPRRPLRPPLRDAGATAARRRDDASAALGRHHGALLYEREVAFLRETEWAVTPADILTRRTKHGLHMSADERRDFERWMEAA